MSAVREHIGEEAMRTSEQLTDRPEAEQPGPLRQGDLRLLETETAKRLLVGSPLSGPRVLVPGV
jgi:hypothetical protein